MGSVTLSVGSDAVPPISWFASDGGSVSPVGEGFSATVTGTGTVQVTVTDSRDKSCPGGGTFSNSVNLGGGGTQPPMKYFDCVQEGYVQVNGKWTRCCHDCAEVLYGGTPGGCGMKNCSDLMVGGIDYKVQIPIPADISG